MTGVFANRTQQRDFVISELERLGTEGCEVFIAVAFFTEADVVKRLLEKGCRVRMVVRLGFPTSPSALQAVMKHNNLSLRVFSSTSFHPKLYIFGDDVALVGSANLTHTAITSNQEVVVSIHREDERFNELAIIFQDYWDEADVPTDQQLKDYAQLYKKYEVYADAADNLTNDAARHLGNTAPSNINRGGAKRGKQALFLSNYRKAYQEAAAAFDILRRIYKATGYRKASEADIPLRLEIDSFISFVRDTETRGDSWQVTPYRTEAEQQAPTLALIDKWKVRPWPYFEDKIVGETFPRLMATFETRESLLKANNDELFDALCTLHSFHDRLRFYEGGLPKLKTQFLAANDPARLRESLAYLVFGDGDVVERMANTIYDRDYRLNEFGQANVQELIGWRNREDLPVINGRTTKVLRFLGSKVRQIS